LGVVLHGPPAPRFHEEAIERFGKGHFEEAKAGPAGCGVRSGGSPENHKKMSKNEHLNLEPPILYLVGGLEHFLYFSIYWE